MLEAMWRSMAAAMAALAATSGWAGTTVARQGQAGIVVVSQAGASSAELHAAEDLRRTLSKIVGSEIPLESDVTDVPQNAIVVGQGPVARKLLPDEDWAKLGPEQTLLESRGSDLVVAGGAPRGTLYAVDRLLHRLGVRWWTPWATTVPHNPNLTLPTLHESETPAFEYRDPYWFQAFDGDWAVHNYDNGFNIKTDPERGGKVLYAGFVHTYNVLVPPDKLFATHPEWFSLIDGKRTAANAQLCTTNPELRDYIVEQVKQTLRQNHDAKIVSVSQNDCFNPCQCPVCRALAEKEGSDSALVLDLANYVAEKIQKEFPDVAVDTLAYQWSRKAPLAMRPRPNVIVRLCSIECNFAYPLDAPQNASFAQDVANWSRLTNRLYVWDYCTDFANYVEPQPDYFTFGETLKFLADHGTKGIFEEGAYQSTGADMAELKAWVLAQLMWNPRQDVNALIQEFLVGYYGPAARPIWNYLQLMQEQAKTVNLGFAAPVTQSFLGYDAMRQAESDWQQAEAAVQHDPAILWRVRQGHLSVQYVWLSRWDEFRQEAAKRGDAWPMSDSRAEVATQWLATATGPGPAGWSPITHLDEGHMTPQQFVGRLGGDVAPPPAPKQGNAP